MPRPQTCVEIPDHGSGVLSRLPGLGSDSVKAVFIKSKMMATTLMSLGASVYDGRREVLTHKSFILSMKSSKLHDVAPRLPNASATTPLRHSLR